MDKKPRTEAKIKQMLAQPVDPVYRELSAKLKSPKSEIMPRVLAKLMTLQQAKIVNALPATPAEIAQKLNVSKEAIDKDIQELYEKGVLFPGKSGWHMIRSWGALHDSAGASNTKFLSDEFLDLAFAEHDEQIQDRIEEVRSGKEKVFKTGMRVIPRWRSIKDVPGVLPIEDAREIFRSAEPIAIVDCACRKIDRNRDCKDVVPLTTCVTFGRSAEYNLKRGAGKKLSYKEAMDLMDSFDKVHLVHLTGNRNTMPNLVCNCHTDCCGSFHRTRSAKKALNQSSLVQSRFIASVDTAKCRGCQMCIKVCPIGAAQMKSYTEYPAGKRAYIDAEECIGCGLCVISCVSEARKMNLVRPPEHIPPPECQFTADGTD